LNSDNSLVRVIFTDNNDDDFMVFESYPLISTRYTFSVEDKYDETYCLDELIASSIKLEIIDASLTIDELTISEEACENTEADRYAAKRALDEKKSDTMNLRIEDFGMSWTATDSYQASLYYNEKAVLYGENYNLLGWDYYEGGIFELLGITYSNSESSSYVRHFDWRTRHDAIDSLSKYYDGQSDSTGWMTKKSEQGGCQSCWVFGPTAVFEGLVNLYYNAHLDFNLSEQYLFSCSDDRSCDEGGFFYKAIDTAIEHGMKTEACFPYYKDIPADTYNCGDTCSNSDTLVFATARESVVKTNNDSIKSCLFKYGPLVCRIVDTNYNQLDHVMALVGYKTDWTDTVTVWIFKDSEQGDCFKEIKHWDGMFYRINAIKYPLEIIDTSSQYEIPCYDKDNDGYYWWGIGAKPDTCPDCPDEPDCNDNNPYIGPCDSCYFEICNYQFESEAIHIITDTTWNDTTIVQNTIIVDSGYSLTIRSMTMFVKHSGIIVKPGGKLNLFGATLTKVCSDLWKGIEVWGDSDTMQNFAGLQGSIRVDSNTLIEYAETGIIAGCKDIDPEEISPYIRAGGIVKAQNSHFVNNTVDIEFQPYRNLHPYEHKVELSNKSDFNNCVFETDNNELNYFPPDKHVVLNGVKDVNFSGCTFKGSDGLDLNKNADRDKGYGIYSLGSSFYVDNYCSTQSISPCPDSLLKTSSFENLRYGIYGLEWNTSRLIRIDSATFKNNICGILLSGTTNSSIIRNEIEVAPIGVDNDTACGIYLESCTGYQIEENEIYSNAGVLGSALTFVGLYVKNSGDANNEIYNNQLHNNYYATIIEGTNRGDSTGLCIKCNDYRQNWNDIFVLPDTSLKDLQIDQGVAEYQGSVTDTTTTGPAGNTFTEFVGPPDTNLIRYFNYLNDTTEFFNYLHHDYSREDPRIYPENVNDSSELIIFHYKNKEYSKTESCPSTLGGSIESMQSNISTEQLLIDQLQSDLLQNVDGGNTSVLLNSIQYSTSAQSNSLRQQLMNSSPYLSDTVISSAIEKETVLPNPYLRDIMSANPHSSRKDDHIEMIDNRNLTMPEYMKSQVINSQYGFDALDILKSEKQIRENKKDSYINNLIRFYKGDTNYIYGSDSVISFIINEQNIYRKIQASFEYFSIGDSISSRATIIEILNEYDLNSYEDSTLGHISYILDVLINKKSRKITEFELDSIEIAKLINISNDGLPVSSIAAENLLQANNILYKKERFYFPEFTSLKSRRNYFQNNTFEKNYSLKVIPNPAKDFVLVDYELNEPSENNFLKVFNVSGINIYALRISRPKDQVMIDIHNWQSGMYVVILGDNNGLIQEKFVVVK